jgi:hypothetical protein
MKSNSKPIREPFPGSSLLTNLLPLLTPAPPTFPTFSQLVEEDRRRQSAVSATKQTGLFSELLGDPQTLLQDLISDPDKYEDGVYNLLLPLVSGQRKLEDLNPEERALLDRAVVDYSQAAKPPPPPEPPTPPPKKEKTAAKGGEPIEEEIEYHESNPFPQGAPGAYWWLR